MGEKNDSGLISDLDNLYAGYRLNNCVDISSSELMACFKQIFIMHTFSKTGLVIPQSNFVKVNRSIVNYS